MTAPTVDRAGLARWLAGAAGLGAVGTIAGVTVARSMTRRAAIEDPYAQREFRDARRRPQLSGDDARRRAAGGARGRARRRATDRGVRARILSSNGRLPLSAHAAVRRVGSAGPDDLLRPARPRPIRRRSAGDLHDDPAGHGLGDRAAGDRATRPDRGGRPFDGWDDGVVARPAVPSPLRQPHRRGRVDFVCGRRGGEVTAGRDSE